MSSHRTDTGPQGLLRAASAPPRGGPVASEPDGLAVAERGAPTDGGISGPVVAGVVQESDQPGRPRTGNSVVQERTQELFSRLPHATAGERQLIRDEVVTLHLGLADRAARRYGLRSEHEDLVQVARIGLVEAFDRYDPSRVSYVYFAWVTMSGLLRRHLRDHGWSVRPPRSTQEAANTLRRTVPELTQELGRPATTADLATYLGWTADAVRAARQAELGLQATSIDALVGDAWVPQHPSEFAFVETRLLLGQAAEHLSEPERELLRLRFVDELTQTQIGAVLGVTQMQVSRLLAGLMAKLRAQIGDLDERSAVPDPRP